MAAVKQSSDYTDLALDFDGVICDSVNECCISAWNAAQSIWPEEFIGAPSPDYFKHYRQWRPVIHDCYDLLLLSHLAQKLADSLEPPPAVTPQYFDEYLAGLEGAGRVPFLRSQGVEIIGAARDAWTAQDPKGWLGSQTFYPGIVVNLKNLVSSANPAVHIVTKKPRRFVHALCDFHGVPWDDTLIFAGEDGEKSTYIQRLLSQGRRIAFVEDRLRTIMPLAEESHWEQVDLYLATWGYVTPADCQSAHEHHRITPIKLSWFGSSAT